MIHELVISLTTLFIGLFIAGTILCLALYKWNYIAFFRSSLWTKIYFWIPLFIGLVAILYLQNLAAIPIAIALVTLAIREYYRLKTKKSSSFVYLIVMCVFLIHIALPYSYLSHTLATSFFVAVAFSSVLSDVFAYFLGNFIGNHKLPASINPNKSWEGVSGQIVGAFCGFLMVTPFLPTALPLIVALIVGTASACGDIANSIVKRQARVKDWGMTIPGHGGVLDRFSSLAAAIFATFWWMVLFY